jgi:hypothetical protein
MTLELVFQNAAPDIGTLQVMTVRPVRRIKRSTLILKEEMANTRDAAA